MQLGKLVQEGKILRVKEGRNRVYFYAEKAVHQKQMIDAKKDRGLRGSVCWSSGLVTVSSTS